MTACGAKQSRTLRVPFDRICRSWRPFEERVPDIIVSIFEPGAHFGGARDLRPNMRPKVMEVSSRYPGYDSRPESWSMRALQIVLALALLLILVAAVFVLW